MDYKEFFERQKYECRLPRWDELPDIELYMDQVITLMGKYLAWLSPQNEPILTSSMINNYVKIGIIPPPVKKKYSRAQLFRLIIICVMKRVLPINDIAALIETLLETRTEEEVLDIFTSCYEEECFNTISLLEKSLENSAGEESKAALSLSVIQAAAIAGGNILFSEYALSELQKSAEAPEKQAEKPPRKSKAEVRE
ncbi:MAG TPA: fatty acid-binding protein DegV [Ruminococcaceae bacterium]|mgnify:FL=1|nr:fatty acid-binding protein DegV [Oscillospiraceae bacterium]